MLLNRYMLLLLIINSILFQSTSVVGKDQDVKSQSEQFSGSLLQAIDIRFGTQKLLSFIYDETQYKPYIKEIYTPNGINVLLDSPSDHKHHHGLMYAIKVDGINFWEETEKCGYQILINTSKITDQTSENVFVKGFLSEVLWKTSDQKEILLMEKRQIQCKYCPKNNATLLTWQSELKIPDSKKSVTLTGAHYHGLGMRFIKSMDKKGHFFTASKNPGKIFRGSERLIPDQWCAYTAQDEKGQKVTVAMFGHPENLGGETIWFTMKDPFAYLSATMTLHEKSFIIKHRQTILLKYGVALWDGEVHSNEVEKIYQNWLHQVDDGS